MGALEWAIGAGVFAGITCAVDLVGWTIITHDGKQIIFHVVGFPILNVLKTVISYEEPVFYIRIK